MCVTVLVATVAMSVTGAVVTASTAAAQVGVDPSSSGWDIITSGSSLNAIDPFTNSLLGTDVREVGAVGTDITDVVTSNFLDAEALRVAEQARADLERRRRAAMAGQTEVGPDGCPVSAPPRGVQTANEIDLNDVCARSVAEARTPAAANAIKYALTHLGNPYSQEQRNQEGFYDCSSFVSRSYEETGTPVNSKGNGGWPLVTWHFTGTNGFSLKPFIIPIDPSEAKAGDALLFADAEHMVMKLVDGLITESPRKGEVTRVKELWFTPGFAAWVDPSLL